MKILVSKYAGFCFGVERAINMVNESASKKEKLYTIGPLIHNPQVVKRLEKKGVSVIQKKDIDNLDKGANVVIRSHGITKDLYKKLKNKELNIIDATCPFVKTAQKKAEYLMNQDYDVYIYGEKQHPEVKSILSYSDYKGKIIEDYTYNADDIEKDKKCGIVTQTTRNKKRFAQLCENFIIKSKELRIYNTICDATFKRQKDAKKIAKKVDYMIIVGGKNSANTTKLYNITKNIIPAIHVETVKELNENVLKKYNKIGVTAGASTPEFLIDEVIEKLKLI